MYAEIKDGSVVTWPYNWDNLVKNNPNTSFPMDVGFQAMYDATQASASGNLLVKVIDQEPPAHDPSTQMLVRNSRPTLIGPTWTLGWTVLQLTPEQKIANDAEQAKSVRDSRNAKLKDSDWTQVADAPVDKAVWATYRQALRDISTQAGFPWEVTWPTEP